jgi:hypothetical protein
MYSVDVMWIEFKETISDVETAATVHDTPKVGYSLLMSPFNRFHTWQTTEITEIVSQDGDAIEFKTLNSTYKLEKL